MPSARAMTIMLEDNHYEPLQNGNQLNHRILDLYLTTLDPNKLYFTQEDVVEFTHRYTKDPRNALDIMLLRESRNGASP